MEAKKVTRNTGIIVQTAVGGSAKRFGLNKIKNEGCHVLIGTPGRLNDVLSDPYTGIKAPKLSALVLDEADRLLDDGFSREIEAIQDLLPRRDVVNRQTLLFSATVPPEVMDMVRRNTKPDYKFVRTVQKGEVETHEKVPQKVVNVGGFENLMPAIVELCKRELDRKDEMPFKAIVYFPATAEVSLAALTLRNLKQPGESFFGKHPLAPAKIVEMHGKLTQEQRTRAADSFRHAECAIMLSSDVTARGMDFPNVTHVIQVGLPSNRDIYIHRIGRTARGDKKGEGWLLVTDMEMREVRYRLSSLPIAVDKSLETSHVDMSKDAQLPESTAKTLTQTIDATRMVDPNVKAAAYVACLGIFSWSSNKQKLVDSMNSRAKHCWGMPIPPSVSPRLVSKLNFRGVQGLNIGPSRDDDGEELRPLRDPGRGYTDRDRSPFGAGRSRIGSISRSSSYGDDAGGFRDRNGGGYGDRSRGGYVDRSGGEYGNRSRGEHGDRSGGEYGNRSRGEYGDRSGGGYGSRSSGGYGDRNSGGNPWAGRGRV